MTATAFLVAVFWASLVVALACMGFGLREDAENFAILCALSFVAIWAGIVVNDSEIV